MQTQLLYKLVACIRRLTCSCQSEEQFTWVIWVIIRQPVLFFGLSLPLGASIFFYLLKKAERSKKRSKDLLLCSFKSIVWFLRSKFYPEPSQSGDFLWWGFCFSVGLNVNWACGSSSIVAIAMALWPCTGMLMVFTVSSFLFFSVPLFCG